MVSISRLRPSRNGWSDLDTAGAGGREAETNAFLRWLFILLAALLVWRMGALYFAQTELFFDEAQYWYWSTEPAFGYYSKPPLIAWVIGASTALCGSSEFCIRLPAPLIHTGTALFIFAAARRLYDVRTGVFAALAFATLPAVSLSSSLIATDTPLLFFWAAALYALVVFRETRTFAAAAGLGTAIGFGLLSKYAMIYFVLCAAVWAIWSSNGRALWREPRFYLAPAIAAVIVAPNVVWNIENQFATFSHTADNANLGGPLFNPSSLAEFLGGQLGVMGPVLFVALVMTALRALRSRLDERDRMLLCFSLPIILLISLQAFISRAHANWAATAYVAATILVIAVMLRQKAHRALAGSFALHGAAVVILALALAFAPRISFPGKFNPFERVLGWRDMAAAADELAREHDARALASDRRAFAAELNYYSRSGLPVKAWNTPGSRPDDHFELKHPVTAETPGPLLLVSATGRTGCIAEHYVSVEPLGQREVETGVRTRRIVHFFLLSGPVPQAFASEPAAKPGCS